MYAQADNVERPIIVDDVCSTANCPPGTRCRPVVTALPVPGPQPFVCEPVTVECGPCPPGSKPCTWRPEQDFIAGPIRSDEGRCYATFCHPTVNVVPQGVLPSGAGTCGCTYTLEVPCDWKPPVPQPNGVPPETKPACPDGKTRLPVVGCVPKWVPWAAGGVLLVGLLYALKEK